MDFLKALKHVVGAFTLEVSFSLQDLLYGRQEGYRGEFDDDEETGIELRDLRPEDFMEDPQSCLGCGMTVDPEMGCVVGVENDVPYYYHIDCTPTSIMPRDPPAED